MQSQINKQTLHSTKEHHLGIMNKSQEESKPQHRRARRRNSCTRYSFQTAEKIASVAEDESVHYDPSDRDECQLEMERIAAQSSLIMVFHNSVNKGDNNVTNAKGKGLYEKKSSEKGLVKFFKRVFRKKKGGDKANGEDKVPCSRSFADTHRSSAMSTRSSLRSSCLSNRSSMHSTDHL